MAEVPPQAKAPEIITPDEALRRRMWIWTCEQCRINYGIPPPYDREKSDCPRCKTLPDKEIFEEAKRRELWNWHCEHCGVYFSVPPPYERVMFECPDCKKLHEPTIKVFRRRDDTAWIIAMKIYATMMFQHRELEADDFMVKCRMFGEDDVNILALLRHPDFLIDDAPIKKKKVEVIK